MKVKETTKLGIVANAKRVVEILDSIGDTDNIPYWEHSALLSELKCKMRELRRDTLKLEKEIKAYWEGI